MRWVLFRSTSNKTQCQNQRGKQKFQKERASLGSLQICCCGCCRSLLGGPICDWFVLEGCATLLILTLGLVVCFNGEIRLLQVRIPACLIWSSSQLLDWDLLQFQLAACLDSVCANPTAVHPIVLICTPKPHTDLSIKVRNGHQDIAELTLSSLLMRWFQEVISKKNSITYPTLSFNTKKWSIPKLCFQSTQTTDRWLHLPLKSTFYVRVGQVPSWRALSLPACR